MIKKEIRKVGWVVSWFLVCSGLVLTVFGLSDANLPVKTNNESESVVEKSDLSDVFVAMTVSEKIGQLIAAPVSGVDTETASGAASIEAGFVGLFEFDEMDGEQISKVVENINVDFDARNKLMPMVFVDFEGGRVNRFRGHLGDVMGLEVMCKNLSPEEVEVKGLEVGQILTKELGVDGIWGPVADRANNKSEVLRTRTCSDDPGKIKDYVGAYVKGLNDAGVFSVVKHYPGLGGTNIDPHFVDGSIESVDWEVFEPLVKMASGVMTTHVSVGEDSLPCTLSSKCLAPLNELRLSGGEEFLVFSDDMGMDSVDENYSDLESAYLAVMAGVDVLVYGKGFEYERLDALVLDLEEIYSRDPYFRARVDESVIRILRSKENKN